MKKKFFKEKVIEFKKRRLAIIAPQGIGDLVMLMPVIERAINDFEAVTLLVKNIGVYEFASEYLSGVQVSIITRRRFFDLIKDAILNRCDIFVDNEVKLWKQIPVYSLGLKISAMAKCIFLHTSSSKAHRTVSNMWFYQRIIAGEEKKQRDFHTHDYLKNSRIAIEGKPKDQFVVGMHVKGEEDKFQRAPDFRYWEELIKMIMLDDRYQLFIIIGPEEINIKNKISRYVEGLKKKPIIYCGTSLHKTIMLLNRCNAFIGFDGGIGHIAALYEVPSYVTYIGTNPARIGVMSTVCEKHSVCQNSGDLKHKKLCPYASSCKCRKKCEPKLALLWLNYQASRFITYPDIKG